MAEAMAGALLGTLVADAMGVRWEGSRPAEGRTARLRVEASLDDPELRYSDDTQLTLALAEHLLDHPEVEPEELAWTFLDHYEPWRGYGGGMHGIVSAWQSGLSVDEAVTAVFPDGSLGNGAAMRVAPVGVLWAHDAAKCRAAAERQARVTHAHPIGVDGAVVQAAAVARAATQGAFGAADAAALADVAHTGEMRAGLAAAAELVPRWRDGALDFVQVAAALGNRAVAHLSVPAAVWVAAVAVDFAEAVELALGLGGDADTIAAMSGAILGAAGLRPPQEWLERCEDGPRGRSYAADLARRLAG